MPETVKMTAKIVSLNHFRAERQRRLMLEAAAEHDLVLATLLAQNHPILSDAPFQPPEPVSKPGRPQPPSE